MNGVLAMVKPTYARTWELEEWAQDIWHHCFQCSFKGLMNISLMEANVKTFTRWYRVPTQVAKIYPDSSSLCFRGCNIWGSLFLTWWSCRRIRGFWNKLFQMMHEVMGSAIPQNPKIALLNHKVKNPSKYT